MDRDEQGGRRGWDVVRVKVSVPMVVVAGVASGVGKTTVTLGLLEAYRRRGLAVQAFKVGPDFIDPSFHELVTGRASYNLDGWMCGRAAVMDTVARHARDADLAIVEGMMGCFDGVDAASDEGSTAEIAKWLEAPVVLVLDASGQSRSAAAVVLGFQHFDPTLRFGGVISNRVGGETHGRWVGEVIAAATGARPLGAIPFDRALPIPERHLGLVTAMEGTWSQEKRGLLAAIMERSVNLDGLLALARAARPTIPSTPDPPPAVSWPCARIGVARDAAFQFYYAENLYRLRSAGARLVFWSPLEAAEVPDVDGLYLGGGYPELYARRLADNASLRASIRRFADAGRPIYAECGGLMYLADILEDADGERHPMVGLLPTAVRMRPRRMMLAYSAIETTQDGLLGPKGTRARGHQFHFSTLDPVPDSVERVYRVGTSGGGECAEGYRVGSALMSYVHLHFASNPDLAPALVAACTE
jgi:cobyrinic acid a,c-diamide synthase